MESKGYKAQLCPIKPSIQPIWDTLVRPAQALLSRSFSNTAGSWNSE